VFTKEKSGVLGFRAIFFPGAKIGWDPGSNPGGASS